MNEDDNVIDWSKYGKDVLPIKIHSVLIQEAGNDIIYDDIIDYQIGPNLIAISMKDDVVHFHFTKDITYIKSYFKENTQ
jgi:hypothetical protein